MRTTTVEVVVTLLRTGLGMLSMVVMETRVVQMEMAAMLLSVETQQGFQQHQR